jgi:hypothetical protein
MVLHPYDGVDRRFRHTDAERETGLAIVAQLLRLPQLSPSHAVRYDLSFYSGGMGILDNLAITLQADRLIWASVAEALHAKTPEQASQDADWAGELIWLFNGEEESVQLRESAAQFINRERGAFQSECHAADCILLADGSGVNWWLTLWGDDMTLNYRSYDQG